MTISYNWLCEYLPKGQPGNAMIPEPERLSRILTSIGLEVESMHAFEEVKGSLKGLIIGEVMEVEKHPNADKLTVTRVSTGNHELLQIVCGAPNVAAGQKVIVAKVGTTIHPVNGEPVTMKIAKIRGVESHGMICAEDEIGLGHSHAGIMVLPADLKAGMPAAEHFNFYNDTIFEIGLTPNRMDAMSHWGVARDLCAYLSHHQKKDIQPVLPGNSSFSIDNNSLPFEVKVEDGEACPRYSGITLTGIEIKESPLWLQQKLKAIGQRPINNIVDITNFVLHETGQPLHAFDADKIPGHRIVVKKLPEGTKFVTLDEKERKLSKEDLVICAGADKSGAVEKGLCIAGVFGGLNSGITIATKNIFLESACFDPVTTRKTSFRHGLRTDAAARFEKGTDISATVNVLKRAAALIREVCGGQISSEIVDIYPQPKAKTEVVLRWHYLKKLTGKNYHPDKVKNILDVLGYEIIKESIDELSVSVPYHKPDVSLPADLVEEIIRIDGLDNIEIPDSVSFTPSVQENASQEAYRSRVAGALNANGFHEIMTNSITNAAYYTEEEQKGMVKMLNSLSANLNILRSSLLETALEVVAFNLNRKNNSLRLFEFGKTYSEKEPGQYKETEKLCVAVSGDTDEKSWNRESRPADLYFLKGMINALLHSLGLEDAETVTGDAKHFKNYLEFRYRKNLVGAAGEIKKELLLKNGIKQAVFIAEMDWDSLSELAAKNKNEILELPRYPFVQRDLALVVSKNISWEKIQDTLEGLHLACLAGIKPFDIFESEKIGTGNKSVAISLTFIDPAKTLTDKEIDELMNTLIAALEKNLGAGIRK